jgi:hypothetical protein
MNLVNRDHLVDLTPDRGKEAEVSLDWSDIELVKRVILRRVNASSDLDDGFDVVWMRLFDPHVKGNDSFRYILDRTFLRPRDVLNFARLAMQIAVSLDHQRVEEVDILSAERSFSEGMLNDLRHEMRDVFPNNPDVLGAFRGSRRLISDEDLTVTLVHGNAEEADVAKIIDTLLWFSFIGVVSGDEERYSYQLGYQLSRLKALGGSGRRTFAVHPAFHMALETVI